MIAKFDGFGEKHGTPSQSENIADVERLRYGLDDVDLRVLH